MGRDHMVRWEGAESELKLYLSAQLILEETDSTHLLKIHHILVTTGFVIEHPCWGIHIIQLFHPLTFHAELQSASQILP